MIGKKVRTVLESRELILERSPCDYCSGVVDDPVIFPELARRSLLLRGRYTPWRKEAEKTGVGWLIDTRSEFRHVGMGFLHLQKNWRMWVGSWKDAPMLGSECHGWAVTREQGLKEKTSHPWQREKALQVQFPRPFRGCQPIASADQKMELGVHEKAILFTTPSRAGI